MSRPRRGIRQHVGTPGLHTPFTSLVTELVHITGELLKSRDFMSLPVRTFPAPYLGEKTKLTPLRRDTPDGREVCHAAKGEDPRAVNELLSAAFRDMGCRLRLIDSAHVEGKCESKRAYRELDSQPRILSGVISS